MQASNFCCHHICCHEYQIHNLFCGTVRKDGYLLSVLQPISCCAPCGCCAVLCCAVLCCAVLRSAVHASTMYSSILSVLVLTIYSYTYRNSCMFKDILHVMAEVVWVHGVQHTFHMLTCCSHDMLLTSPTFISLGSPCRTETGRVWLGSKLNTPASKGAGRRACRVSGVCSQQYTVKLIADNRMFEPSCSHVKVASNQMSGAKLSLQLLSH